MDQLLKVILILFSCLQLASVHALDLSKINFQYQYDVESKMNFQYRVVETDAFYLVYYTVNTERSANWMLSVLNQDSYNSAKHDTLSVSIDSLFRGDVMLDLMISVDKSADGLLLLCLADLDKGVYRIVDISLRSPVGFPTFLPQDKNSRPILSNYVTTNYLSASSDSKDRLIAYRYLEDFGESDPPMGSMKPLAPSLTIDSVFTFQEEINDLKDYHFYLLQEDSLDDKGVTVLKCPAYYPEYKKLEELIGPMVYITTPNEIKSLRDLATKKVFEQFWINTYGTKFRAKSAIKLYYDRVEQANILFTDYKQGWKTDRGMLYIIFGKPQQVLKSQNTEIWKYNEDIQFEFIKISTLFTPALYSLKRDRKYEKMWYNQVGNIRKGI